MSWAIFWNLSCRLRISAAWRRQIAKSVIKQKLGDAEKERIQR